MIWTAQDAALARAATVVTAAVVLLLSFSGCSEYGLKALDDEEQPDGPGDDGYPSDDDDQSDDDDDTSDPVETDDDDDDDDVGDDDDDDTDPEPEPGSDPNNPRPLLPGDLVINELMIDPVDVPDADGEYVELRNNGGAWVEFEGLRLKDWGVDDAPVEPVEPGSITLGPGAFYVICVLGDFWDNGGVECDATIEYSTWGGGFALSNTEDEVVLAAYNGVELDLVAYDDSLVEPGEAAGVDPDYSSVSANNDLNEWCMQWAMLPFGGTGSPGESNDNCF